LFSSSPAGLRLEIRFKIDKKKMNFIFHRREKIFLTKKPKRTSPREHERTIVQADFAATPGPNRPLISGELLWLIGSCAALLS
jgi:hypothetical protein